MTSGAHAAGEASVCLVETDHTDADQLRDAVNAVAANVGAEIQVVQLSVKYGVDFGPVIDRLVAGGCHLIGVTSDGPTRAIIVLYAPDGPMPQTRASARIVGQIGLEDIVVFVRGVHLVDDPELLELEKLEMQELMSASGLPGDDIPFEQCTPECRGEPFPPGG
jgi:hypothetical protein